MHTTENKRWLRDSDGWYWVADLLKDGNKVGITGNYYALEERLKERPTEEE